MSDQHVAEPFWKSPFVLGMGAMVLAAVIANIVMVTISVTGAPGLVSEDYYARGKSYTSRTRIDYLAPRGVGATITGIDGARVGEPTLVSVASDRPMKEATLYAYRPADATADFSVALSPDGKGGFSALVLFPLKGNWDIIVEPVADGETSPGIARRVVVGE